MKLKFFFEFEKSHKISRLYVAGAQPDILKLYHPISYPVGHGTPMLNSKVGWSHTQHFIVPNFEKDMCKSA